MASVNVSFHYYHLKFSMMFRSERKTELIYIRKRDEIGPAIVNLSTYYYFFNSQMYVQVF